MIVKLLTEHHLKFLSFRGGCRGSSESTLVKMSNCWKSHAAAQIYNLTAVFFISIIGAFGITVTSVTGVITLCQP